MKPITMLTTVSVGATASELTPNRSASLSRSRVTANGSS
jgi:hypothetical protein